MVLISRFFSDFFAAISSSPISSLTLNYLLHIFLRSASAKFKSISAMTFMQFQMVNVATGLQVRLI